MRDVVDDDGAVGVAVVHGRERLVPLLACRVPDLELDGRVLVEGERLREEGGADGRLAVFIELVLFGYSISFCFLKFIVFFGFAACMRTTLTFTNRDTSDV